MIFFSRKGIMELLNECINGVKTVFESLVYRLWVEQKSLNTASLQTKRRS